MEEETIFTVVFLTLTGICKGSNQALHPCTPERCGVEAEKCAVSGKLVRTEGCRVRHTEIKAWSTLLAKFSGS